MSDKTDLMIEEYCQHWCKEKNGCRKDCAFYAERNINKVQTDNKRDNSDVKSTDQ